VDLQMKNHGNHGDLQKAIEHGPVEIVDSPMKNMVNFDSYVSYVAVSQRVTNLKPPSERPR
jgi:hypothetical protein